MIKKYIKGNTRRSKEILQVLQQLGGVIEGDLFETIDGYIYYIDPENNVIRGVKADSRIAKVITSTCEKLSLREDPKTFKDLRKGDIFHRLRKDTYDLVHCIVESTEISYFGISRIFYKELGGTATNLIESESILYDILETNNSIYALPLAMKKIINTQKEGLQNKLNKLNQL